MRIAITATGADLEANVDPRFGRCPYFLFVETDDLSFEATENPNLTLGGGAGIQSAQLMAAKGVKHVLTGNCGPNAYQTLAAAGIAVVVGCGGTVADVVEQFKAGQLNATAEPSVAGKFGLGGASGAPQEMSMPPQQPPVAGPQMGMGGGGQGMGRGRGGGRGMGQGRGGGRGMGQGRGMGMGVGLAQGSIPTPQPPAQNLTRDEELAMLKQQTEAMNQQMQQTYERIRQLEQEGKTRTMVAKVDAEKCTGCGICVDICPVEAISLENGMAVVDERTCTACGLCVNECPNEAISMG